MGLLLGVAFVIDGRHRVAGGSPALAARPLPLGPALCLPLAARAARLGFAGGIALAAGGLFRLVARPLLRCRVHLARLRACLGACLGHGASPPSTRAPPFPPTG